MLGSYIDEKYEFNHFFLLTAKLEFALTVLKPEPQSDPPDQLFLLAPTIIQKEDILVCTWMYSNL